jgi:hypothetical protein
MTTADAPPGALLTVTPPTTLRYVEVMRFFLPLLVAVWLARAAGLDAQDPSTPEPDPQSAGSVLQTGPSPLGAFLRAIAVPSWGHASIGSYQRGAFYLAAEGGTAWMLWKTSARRSSAREILSARETVVRAELISEGVPEEELEAAVEADPRVVNAQTLVEAREGQFEDWLAMGIFLVLLSGADAFVSAHLQDFPETLNVEVGTTPGGGVSVGARIPLGGG